MEKLNVETIIRERVKENENLFTKTELTLIEHNVNIIKKIYIIGLEHGKQIYKKD